VELGELWWEGVGVARQQTPAALTERVCVALGRRGGVLRRLERREETGTAVRSDVLLDAARLVRAVTLPPRCGRPTCSRDTLHGLVESAEHRANPSPSEPTVETRMYLEDTSAGAGPRHGFSTAMGGVRDSRVPRLRRGTPMQLDSC
jgi:hypothetical protein